MKSSAHKWTFRPRFRRNAYGGKPQLPVKRVKEAVLEIKKVAKTDPLVAGEGAVVFLEKVSPALQQVDSSSGTIGSAVNNAIVVLSEIITKAPADEDTRNRWLDRLWEAYENDDMPYLEELGDHWGELCGSPEVASCWADKLTGLCKVFWSPDIELLIDYRGARSCLSALFAAGRYEELLELLDLSPYTFWSYHQYGVKALAALGRKAEAIDYAEEHRGPSDDPVPIARACEEVLLSSGLVDEAYERYGLLANQARGYLAWFRAVVKTYPHKAKAEVLADLMAFHPYVDKWFSVAKSAKLFDEAIKLARSPMCPPNMLARAARDYKEKNPGFALEVGMAAMGWMLDNYGFPFSEEDVLMAYHWTMEAAENAGLADETWERIGKLVSSEVLGDPEVVTILIECLECG